MSNALSFLEEGNFHVPSFLELHIVTVSRCERCGREGGGVCGVKEEKGRSGREDG